MYFKSFISGFTRLFVIFLSSSILFHSNLNAQVKITGEAFGDYAYKLQTDTQGRGNFQYSSLKKDYNAFDIRRVAIGLSAPLSPKFIAEALLSHDGNTLPDGSRALYVKFANIRWKGLLPGLDIIIGQQRTPSITTLNGVEQYWGYRPIEKTMLDMRRIAPTFDLGLGFQGCNKDSSRGFDLMIGNNTAAKTVTTTSKRAYFGIYQKFFKRRLIIQLYTDYYRQQANTFTNPDLTTTKGKPYMRSWNAYKLFAAWQTKNFTIGAEAVYQLQRKALAMVDSELVGFPAIYNSFSPFGISAFLRGSLLKTKDKKELLNGFIRADFWNPNTMDYFVFTKSLFPDNDIFLTAGLDYSPMKNVHFMPNIWLSSFIPKNSGIAGTDLVARITFSYKY
jgi:hypothetical protein